MSQGGRSNRSARRPSGSGAETPEPADEMGRLPSRLRRLLLVHAFGGGATRFRRAAKGRVVAARLAGVGELRLLAFTVTHDFHGRAAPRACVRPDDLRW